MSGLDWGVMLLTIFLVIFYGLWKSRGIQTTAGYFLADRKLPWYHVGMSVMATQASAITFLAGPGQGYINGLKFIQFYFGLPFAMVVLCRTFVPAFRNLNVFTAYEFLEKRFDRRTRTLTAALFLLQRGLSTGVTIYAPAIILSILLNIDLKQTILINGFLVLLYTIYGGSKAVSFTQVIQMVIIFSGLFLTAYLIIHLLPASFTLSDSFAIAGKMGKLEAVNYNFDWKDKYNIWSGIIGGFFLQLSYFGTDQSQVGRYLTGASVKESRIGLLLNGIIKIPMQFIILFIGVLVFIFYLFQPAPLSFNQAEVQKVKQGNYGKEWGLLEQENEKINSSRKTLALEFHQALKANSEKEIKKLQGKMAIAMEHSRQVKARAGALMKKNDPLANLDDSNFVYLSFVLKYLRPGVVGLLIAIVFLAAMGSTASGINSLCNSTINDFYVRQGKGEKDGAQLLGISRWVTVGWGILCMGVAFFAHHFGNLLEAVNVLGSFFYGTILGIFMVAFYLKKVGGKATFIAAIITELFILGTWWMDILSFLWLNALGCILVIVIASLLQLLINWKIKGSEVAVDKR